MILLLDRTPPDHPFPPAALAQRDDGLIAMGGDLHPRRLLGAYRAGIFPWYSAGQPILWWSPDPRTVLQPERVHVSRSLRRQLRRGGLELRFDHDFAAVIEACSAPRRDDPETWLVPEMRAAYLELHRMGHAHSVEVWREDRLVGGLYGVALGRMFFGESMFSRVPSASRIALVAVCEHLEAHGCPLIDCQVESPHLLRMGAVSLPREIFLERMETAISTPAPDGLWRITPFDCSTLRHAGR